MADTSTDKPGQVPEKRPDLDFSEAECSEIARFIYQEYLKRKGDRKDEELRWDEVDRQLRMEPLPLKDASGKSLEAAGWLPNLELHTQAQAHEALTADARRLAFPADKSWYTAHACMTDDWLEAARDFSFVPGDKNDTPASGITQEEADVIVESAIENFHRMYSFRQHIDQVFGQSYSYGCGIARVRMMRRDKSSADFRGNRWPADKTIPMVVPRSIRDTYLDDSPSAVMREGFMVAPVQIEYSRLRLADLKLAASMGSTSKDDERGGWDREKLYAITDSETDPFVDVLDFEGDLMIPVGGTPGVYAPNIVGRVVINKTSPTLIRYAKREFPFNSYLTFPYHRLFMGNAYAASPLIFGSPLHKSATLALNTLMAVAALNAAPPTQYDPNDQHMMAEGGPPIYPNAKWMAMSDIKVHMIGDPVAMQTVFGILAKGHEDVTGVNQTRLGAQTKSHQTAFAVDSEIGRGLVRTVDFINDMMDNPFQSMLHMEYEMCKTAYGPKPTPVFADRWDMWLNIARDILPDLVIFNTAGSSGPQEEREAMQKEMAAIQMVLQIEPMVLQLKQQGADVTPLNIDEIRRRILVRGGIKDVDGVLQSTHEAPAAPAAASPDQAAAGPGTDGTAAPPEPDRAAKIIAMATGQPIQ